MGRSQRTFKRLDKGHEGLRQTKRKIVIRSWEMPGDLMCGGTVCKHGFQELGE